MLNGTENFTLTGADTFADCETGTFNNWDGRSSGSPHIASSDFTLAISTVTGPREHALMVAFGWGMFIGFMGLMASRANTKAKAMY
jgi:hypothetical protein